MKQYITSLAIAGSLILACALVYTHFEAKAELRDLARIAAQGDEIQIELHATSLKALTSQDAELVATTTEMLRKLVDVGRQNNEMRRRAGL